MTELGSRLFLNELIALVVQLRVSPEGESHEFWWFRNYNFDGSSGVVCRVDVGHH